jgi:uncharacterized membrane protein
MSGVPPAPFLYFGLLLLYCLWVVLTDKTKKERKEETRIDFLEKSVSNRILREVIRLSIVLFIVIILMFPLIRFLL